ncbi:aldehyde dehydrogenase [Spirulina sp. 06S082]|uniref:aldehyde dehydrogenase n=1 Tax=Spirulina sp. 06S082 TaxID=3110248 RepID=UPI002B204476|nr:aldehyde dehydrogenase [Spirulina sp. 06S082]MEA5468245.1 aldehyde dehydrogenase [Spirulina sp. 06S082]
MLIATETTEILKKQRIFFQTGKTKNIDFRCERLKALKSFIINDREELLDALKQDFNKSNLEGLETELVFCVREINHTLKHLKSWTKSRKITADLFQLPASAKIIAEPLGIILIIGAWNYPIQLAIAPLISAIAAGNCAIVKPSEIAPHSSVAIANLIRKAFSPEYIAVVEGGKEIVQDLLTHQFDSIFFTGGAKVGKIVMEAAAKYLTPVTLELGGKSPCIIEPDIDVEKVAKRVAWGKFINCGQTCIAPDYVLIHHSIKVIFIAKIKDQIKQFYGTNPETSPDYARIINDFHFQRLSSLIDPKKVVIGGEKNPETRYIAPTVMNDVTWRDRIMEEEIFGPVLPILEYHNLEDAIAEINARPKPLSLYLFTHNQTTQERVLTATSSGNVCINDTLMQIASSHLPFGGVGNSGMGAYHGKIGFETFSHQKSVLNRSFLLDLPLRYPPYKGKLKFFNFFLQ